LWRDTWRGLGQTTEHLLEFTANEWRRALFGEQACRARKCGASRRARQRATPSGICLTAPLHDRGDAAAAICIGQVVIRSGAVATALGLSTNTGRNHTV
jgi:hypothetical protein